MAREPLKPEQVFYDNMKSKIIAKFIANRNFHSMYFSEMSKSEIIKYINDLGHSLLGELENTKHLILDETED